ncbi:MAG: trigger factor [Holosporales bacterium]|jgi:trigger factor|nr:trigger factor [Holosporales bacterium]
MKIDNVKEGGMSREYSVTIPADEIEEAIVSAVTKRARTFKMHGFRPGHVPLAVVRSNVEGEIIQTVLESLISKACDDVVKESKVATLATRPTYRIDDAYKPGSDVKITVFIEEAPAVDVKPYDFKITKIVPDVSDDVVDSEFTRMMKARPAHKKAGEGYAAKQLDMVDYFATCYSNGVKNKQRSFKNSTMIPPDEEADEASYLLEFVGKTVGDTIDFTPPSDSSVTFKMQIKEIHEALPGLSQDEYAKECGIETAADFKLLVKELLENGIESAAYLYHKNQILEAIIEQYDFELPSMIVAAEARNVIAEIRAEPEGDDAKKTDSELKEEYADVIKKRVLLGYVLNNIAAKEGIVATDREVQDAIKYEMDSNPRSAQYVADYYTHNEGAIAYKRAEIIEYKVISFIMSIATVTEVRKTREEIDKIVSELLED